MTSNKKSSGSTKTVTIADADFMFSKTPKSIVHSLDWNAPSGLPVWGTDRAFHSGTDGCQEIIYSPESLSDSDGTYVPPPPTPPPAPNPPSCPLILDLDGDGVEAGGIAFFDHEGDGFAEASRWVGADDGLLVWDRNNDGVINNGSELFGNNTLLANGNKATNGFAALSELDSNKDGVVDNKDANFSNLRVLRWVGSDANAASALKESMALARLSDVGVKSLNTGYRTSTMRDKYGNGHNQIGSYTRTDGTTRTMTDVWFVTDPKATVYDASSLPTHSSAINGLPDLTGRGVVYNLRDAMSLDATGKLKSPFYQGTRAETRTLEQLVSAFAASGTTEIERKALADRILLRWAGAESAVASDYHQSGGSFVPGTTPQKVAVVEAFMGSQWRVGQSDRVPGASAAGKVNRVYDWHHERLYSGLMLQTHFKDLSAAITFSLREGADEGSSDFNDYIINTSGAIHALNADKDNVRRLAFISALENAYGKSFILGELSSDWENSHLRRIARPYEGFIRGTRGRDVFDSTRGNTYLSGREGNDVYWLGRGTGHDTINEAALNSGNGDPCDEIRIKSGIKSSDVRFRRDRSNLYVELLSGGVVTDSLRVQYYYTGHGVRAMDIARVEKVVLSSGEVYGVGDFAKLRRHGTSANEGIIGFSDQTDIFDSDAGGIDYLSGRSGNDIYWLGRGTGHDIINESTYNLGSGDSGDEIRVKSGIKDSDVRLRRDRSNLYVELLSGGAVTDSLRVQYYYTDTTGRSRVEKVVLSSGTVYGVGDFANLRRHGTSGVDFISGFAGQVDIFDSDAGGNDYLSGKSGNDIYWLGRGTGHDIINESTYNLGSGDSGDEIRVKSGIKDSDVRLRRDRSHLYVELLSGGAVTDSLRVQYYYGDATGRSRVEKVVLSSGTVYGVDDFANVRRHGTSANDTILGLNDQADVFDSDAGGNDYLQGRSGNDVYYLGRGTGKDVIDERLYNSGNGDLGDEIRVKPGVADSDVRIRRDNNNLYVELLSGSVVTDSLKVRNYYTDATGRSRVEKVVLSSGTAYGVNDFAKLGLPAVARSVRRIGTSGNDILVGTSGEDHFDSDAGGNDILRGLGGNDIYYLGRGTGNDTVEDSGGSGDEIRIKSGIAESSVRLVRRGDVDNLWVELLGSSSEVTDSLKMKDYFKSTGSRVERIVFENADGTAGTVWTGDEIHGKIKIYGGLGNDILVGTSGEDHFDSDAGGNDILRGLGGNDIYYLGRGTGNDTVEDSGGSGDEIRIKSGIASSSVRLAKRGDVDNLYVELLGASGEVTDSLKVKDYFKSTGSRVERIVFENADGTTGTVWVGDELSRRIRIIGSSGNDVLVGTSGKDIFDSDAGGNDILRGLGGNDVYYLGRGTGTDTVEDSGGSLDEIRIKSGIAVSSMRLAKRGGDVDNLWVELLGSSGEVTDSLKVKDYFKSAGSRVERIVFENADGTAGTVWAGDEIRGKIRAVGGLGNDILVGTSGEDRFDSDAGGSDILRGLGGNDVYYLGRGTGTDTVEDSGGSGDEIRIKSGIASSSVRLAKRTSDRSSLWVELLGSSGEVTDSLKVKDYFKSTGSQVERIVFENADGTDGTVWAGDELSRRIRIYGGLGNDGLIGTSGKDIFDSDAGGNDTLYGLGGNDVYYLGRGTGNDTVFEYNTGSLNEIRIKSGIASSSVRLAKRTSDRSSLWVELLGASGEVTDSLKMRNYFKSTGSQVERIVFENADGTAGAVWAGKELSRKIRIYGGLGDDVLVGTSGKDRFDSDAGGNDIVRGLGGNDIYYLGRGTGNDTVEDSGGFDKIRIKYGIDASSVRLVSRGGDDDLRVELLGASGEVTDSLRVKNHYNADGTKVEWIVFENADGTAGTTWDRSAITRNTSFVGEGDDVYWLSRGTGHDVIDESGSNSGIGNSGDEIRVNSNVALSDVRLSRSGDNLLVQLLDSNDAVSDDSLKVLSHFTDASAKVESVHASGKVLLANQYDAYISALNTFNGGTSSFANINALQNHYWNDESTIISPSS